LTEGHEPADRKISKEEPLKGQTLLPQGAGEEKLNLVRTAKDDHGETNLFKWGGAVVIAQRGEKIFHPLREKQK